LGKVTDPLKESEFYYELIEDDGWTVELVKKRQEKLIERFKIEIQGLEET
jgi:hypothetical protein